MESMSFVAMAQQERFIKNNYQYEIQVFNFNYMYSANGSHFFLWSE